MAPTNTVPTSVTPWGTGVFGPYTIPEILLPGHPDFEAGTDVSRPLQWWLSVSIGNADGYSLGSGTDGDLGLVQLQPDETYVVEEGIVFGCRQLRAQQFYTHTDGGVWYWPRPTNHAWKYVTFDLNGSTLHQADPTNYDDGLVNRKVNATIGDGTFQLTQPLDVAQYARYVAGGATIQSEIVGAGKLFSGPVRGTTILAIGVDRQSITVADASVLRNSTSNENVVVYLPPVRPERASGVQILSTEAPGSWNGEPRAGMNVEFYLTSSRPGGTIQGSNPDHESGIETHREGWHALFPRTINGFHLDDTITVRDVYGDFLNCGPSNDTTIDDWVYQVENLTVDATRWYGCGRHYLTAQGNKGIRITGSVAKDIERLAYDSETTAVDARCFDTTIENSTFDVGTLLWHMSPATLNGMPPREIELTLTVGSAVAEIEYDLVVTDEEGGTLTGTGIPDGTYFHTKLSFTEILMSQEATSSGTVTAVLGPAVMYRDITFDRTSVYVGSPTFTGNIQCPPSRVYFSGNTTAGSKIITDIEWDTRLDDLEPSTDLIVAGVKVNWEQNQLFGAPAAPTAKTASTVTMVNNAASTTGPDRTFTATVTAGSRDLTVNTALFDNKIDKGKTLSAAGYLHDDCTVTRVPTPKSLKLSRPALQSGTITVTEGGKARFWINVGPAEWTGFTLTDYRYTGLGQYGGGTPGWDGQNDVPLILLPGRSDGITIERCFATAARNASNQVVREMVGSYQGSPTVVYGQPDWVSDWTVEDNYGVDFTDNQMSAPTVTSTVTLASSSLTSSLPTLTATVVFSDAREETGASVEFFRNGLPMGAAILDGTDAVFVPFDPLGNGSHAITARWAGSYDTASDVSNTVTLNVGAVDPEATTLTLTADPVSPSDAGTTITLTAVVDPDPGAELVTFTVDGTPLATVALEDGTAETSTTLIPGVHTVTAAWAGNTEYLASSDDLTYTSNLVVVDTTAPVVVSVDPFDGEEDVSRVPIVTVTFDEIVTDVVIQLRTDDVPFVTVPGAVSSSDGLVWTFNAAPAGLLKQGRTYVVVVDDAVNEAGLHLVGRFVSEFTVESHELIPTGLLVAR